MIQRERLKREKENETTVRRKRWEEGRQFRKGGRRELNQREGGRKVRKQMWEGGREETKGRRRGRNGNTGRGDGNEGGE